MWFNTHVIGISEKKRNRKQGRGNTERNSGQEFYKSNESHQTTNPRNPENLSIYIQNNQAHVGTSYSNYVLKIKHKEKNLKSREGKTNTLHTEN